jgi:dephospho-CoA kinase
MFWQKRRCHKVLKMLQIGLTGSIGSGKSTVAKLLLGQGIPVLDADQIAKEVSSSRAVLLEVTKTFGVEYVQENGLNRPKLAELIFNKPEARTQLNAIIHPRVRTEMTRRTAELAGAEMVVQDIPLLFENGLEKLFDAVILVDAPLEMRLKRVMARDGSTREQVLARDAAQMPTLEKRKRTKYILENTGDTQNLETQLKTVLMQFKKLRS